MAGEEDGAQRDWASEVASAVVLRGPVPPAAADALRKALGHVELSFLLAQGSPGDGLEALGLLQGGSVPEGPLEAQPAPWADPPSAVARCLHDKRVVCIDEHTADRHELADYRHLQASSGARWLMAAPLICPDGLQLPAPGGGGAYGSGRLLGAVLVASRGAQPSVDGGWLAEWACEMACQIGHASVQLMESSLEVLGVLFPPRVLEQLVANAARKTGQVDLAEVLRSAGGSFASGAGGASPATGPSSLRSSLDDRAALGPPRPSSQQEEGGAKAGSSATTAMRAVSLGAGTSALSPFAAAQAAALAASPPSGAASPLPPGALSPAAVALMRQASVRTGSVASAVLRQISLQSSLSHILQESDAGGQLSPREWEVSGFEDLLEEDHAAVVKRRPSMSLERAHSRPSPCLDHSLAAAAAAVEGAPTLPAVVHGAEAAAAAQQAAQAVGSAAAAGSSSSQPGAGAAAEAAGCPPTLVFDKLAHEAGQPPAADEAPQGSTAAWLQAAGSPPRGGGGELATPPPAARAAAASVRVPWSPKPLLNPLGSSDLEQDPLLTPRKPHPANRAGSGGFGSVASGASSAAFGSAASGASSAAVPPSVFAPAAAHKLGSGSAASLASTAVASSGGVCSLPSTLGSGVSAAGSGCAAPCGPAPAGPSAASAAAALAAAGRAWDGSFTAGGGILEATFRRWLAPYQLRSDACLGCLHCLSALLALAFAWLHGMAPGGWLAVAGALALSSTALPAWLCPAWWQANRATAVCAIRLAVAALFAAHLAARLAPAERPGGMVAVWEALLLDSGAGTLLLLPLRFPLPLSLHLPLHLLCLWVTTVGASLAHMRTAASAAWTLPLPALAAAQLLVGFLVPTWLAYGRESRLRGRFLKSRRAAACLQALRRGRQEGRPPLSQPVRPAFTA